jgi:purine-nucleoside phosphorylase
VLLVLGSGLGPVADAVEGGVAIPFADLPGYPPAGVAGHEGRYVAGALEGRTVLVQQGRYHVYEGHAMDVVAGPVRVAAALGIGTALVTNAAGGIRPGLRPGSLVLIEDHLNLQLRSPLIGPPGEGEPRFPDMTAAYDPSLRARAQEEAAALGIDLVPGVYAAVTGPAYETPAEVRMLERMGADVVGMSTVAEVLAARALGMRILGLSLVTNLAAGIGDEPMDHADVLQVGMASRARMEQLVRAVLARLDA